jgi:tetratricopeptide (TPR) repeat protein
MRDGFQVKAAAFLIHGRPEEARAAFARASREYPSGDTPFHALRIDALPEFEIPPEQLAASRAAAAALIAKSGQDDDKLPMLVYSSGVLAVRAGDLAAARDMAGRLESMPPLGSSSVTADLALALRARILAAQGNPSAALALMEKQTLRIPLRYSLHYAKTGEWFFRASLLEALERRREALPLYDALTFYSYSEPIFLPIAHLRKARIFDAEGDAQRAIEHYQLFADAWRKCDGSERPLLAEADRALKRLRQEIK